MNILITGDLTWVTKDFYDTIESKERKMVISGNKRLLKNDLTRFFKYDYSPLAKEFTQIFRNYNFTVVIFISGSMDGELQRYGENNELEAVLKLCDEYHVEKVIYVTTTEVYAEDIKNAITVNNERSQKKIREAFTSNQILLYAAEELCEFYNARRNLNVIRVHSPYLFDRDNLHSFIGNLLSEGIEYRKVTIPYSKKRQCEFLAVSDLAFFISRIIEDWDRGTFNYDLTSGETITFEELGNHLTELNPDIEVTYTDNITQVYPIPIYSKVPREEYGWFARRSALTELSELFERQKEKQNNRIFLKRVCQRLSKTYGHVRKFVELILLFIGIELINTQMGVYVQFQYIDLRLLYVVLIGSIHGTAMGVMAALLACGANLLGYRTLNINWEIIFYNIDNWIPFVFYILAGAITGYGTNKSRDKIVFIQEQNKLLKKQHLLLNELYENALESKEVYKEQIVSSRESYGKLYSIIQKLDAESPDVVYSEVLKALEDTLGIHSIAIYCVQQKDGSQELKVCSKPLQSDISQIISAKDYIFMEESWLDRELWINSEQLDKYPMYCVRITYRKVTVAYIYVFETEYTKMNVYNSNVIKIICGLAESALHRAYSYQELSSGSGSV